MFRCVTNIVVTQRGAGRNKVLSFGFVTEFSATDTWVDLTNQASVKLPKRLYVRDENGKPYPLDGTNKNIGGFDSETPLFLKGDAITIRFGYRYYRGGNEVLDLPGEGTGRPIYQFEGYITEVISKKPIELKCEDNMWRLKQIPCQPRTWNGSVEDLVASMLSSTPFTVNRLTSTNIGQIVVGNESVAQFLERMRKEANLEAYFRGKELRIGSKIYIDSEAADRVFVFQQNIISDELAYKRKDDIVLSAVCISRFETFSGGTTKDGQAKTKSDRLEILVYWDKAVNDWKYIKKTKTTSIPTNVEGERRTLNYINIKSEAELFAKGVENLKKYFYTGFKGKFTTFGIPYVKQGDNVIIKDPILPERNGKYKVRGVEYSGGVQGHRQVIMLDYKIS